LQKDEFWVPFETIRNGFLIYPQMCKVFDKFRLQGWN